MILIYLIIVALFGYALIYKPEIIAVFFFTITIADINFEIDALHLNMRAIVGIALLIRTLVPEKEDDYPSFFSTHAIYIFLFLFYTVLVTMANDLVDAVFVKTISLTAITVYCGYHYFFKRKNYHYLKLSLMISGLICFADLIYTYAEVGKFPVQRIYLKLLDIPVAVDDNGDFIEVINHGFYGLICGLCFVLLLNEFINKRKSDWVTLVLLPLMFLGVLMSTSRSTLLGIVGIGIFLISRQLRSREHSKKAVKLLTLGISVVFLALFLFATVKDLFNLNSTFLDSITGRLVDEPVAVFYKHMGFNYNAQALDALEWRGESSTNAYDAYLELKPLEQVFGIGYWGFITRNLGRNGLGPHNGFLDILIENGLVGLILYILLVGSIIRKSLFTHPNISPLATILIFIIIYGIGQNEAMTNGTTFVFMVSLIAENKCHTLYAKSSLKMQNA